MQADPAPTPTPTPAAWPGALTLDDAASYLSVSRSMLDRMIDDGTIGPRPINFSTRCPRMIRVQLDAWLAAGCPRRPQWLAMQDQHRGAA